MAANERIVFDQRHNSLCIPGNAIIRFRRASIVEVCGNFAIACRNSQQNSWRSARLCCNFRGRYGPRRKSCDQRDPRCVDVGRPCSSKTRVRYANPGANITGVSVMGTELDAKGLEILAELLAARSTIFLLADPQPIAHIGMGA